VDLGTFQVATYRLVLAWTSVRMAGLEKICGTV
jgi:hypothetical protein